MSSIRALDSYLEAILALDAHAPVSSAVLELVRALNRSYTSRRTLSATEVARALYNSSAASRRMLGGFEQQDAAELFVMLADGIDEELVAAERGMRESSIASLDPASLGTPRRSVANPLRSLMAHRIGCLTCGYVEAIRHTPEDHVTLNVPAAVRQAHL